MQVQHEAKKTARFSLLLLIGLRNGPDNYTRPFALKAGAWASTGPDKGPRLSMLSIVFTEFSM